MIDWLYAELSARRVLLFTETLAAAGFGLLAAFSIVGSSGVKETALLVTMIAAACVASAAVIRFRLSTRADA